MKKILNKIIILLISILFFSFFNINFSIAQDEFEDIKKNMPDVPDAIKDINKKLKDFKKIDQDTIKDFLPTQANLSYAPRPIVIGQPVKVTAQTIGDYGPEDLTYKWYLDNKKQAADGPAFEFNMQDGLIRKNLRCGDYREVKIEVVNHKTDEKVIAAKKIPIGLDLNFSKRTIGSADFNNPQTADFNLSTAEVSAQNIILQVPDIFLQSFTAQEEFRYGDIVEVAPIDLRNTYDNKACNKGAYTTYDEFIKNLGFKWYINDMRQETKSGQGPNFQTAEFLITSTPSQSFDNDTANCGSPTSAINEGQEKVRLEIFSQEGEILASKDEYLKVIAPSINLEPICDAYGKNIKCLNLNSTNTRKPDNIISYQLNPEQEIAFRASLVNFQASEKIEIIWKQNNQAIYNQTINDPNSTTYISPLVKMINKKINVTVEITSYPYSSTNPETTTQQIVITPTQEIGPSTNITGSLKELFPDNFKKLFNFVLAIGLLGIALLIITIREKKKQ